jgi:hypothetical protein
MLALAMEFPRFIEENNSGAFNIPGALRQKNPPVESAGGGVAAQSRTVALGGNPRKRLRHLQPFSRPKQPTHSIDSATMRQSKALIPQPIVL